MSNDRAPCACCKFFRRKCTEDCAFAPYLPQDQTSKFEKIHKVFGASNVAKIIKELKDNDRQQALDSLAYEAEQRIRDPIYGCVGYISLLQQERRHLEDEISKAKRELAQYICPDASPEACMGWSSRPNFLHRPRPVRGGSLVIREPQQQLSHHYQQQQDLEAQMAMAREQYEQQLVQAQQLQYQQQLVQARQEQIQLHDFCRLNSGFEGSGSGTATGFNEIGSSQQPYYQTEPEQQHEQQQRQTPVLFQPQQPQHGNDFLNLQMQPGEQVIQEQQQQPQTPVLFQPQQLQHGNDFLNLQLQPGEELTQQEQQQELQTQVLLQPQQPQHGNDFLNLQMQLVQQLIQEQHQQQPQTQVLFQPQQPQHGNDFLNLQMQQVQQLIQKQQQQQQQPQTQLLFQPQQPPHGNDFLNLQMQTGEELAQQEQQQELQTHLLFNQPQQPDERFG